MEKPKHIPIIDHSKPKKTPTNFVRANTGNLPDKKAKAPANKTKKPQGFIKKQDESWEY
jgi:hypothetical protein